MVIDVERIKSRTFSTLNSVSRSLELGLSEFVVSGKDTYRDLQTLISFDTNRGIVVSCRRSSMLFMGNLVIYSFAMVLGFRFLVYIGLGIRNQLGLGLGFGHGNVVVRRDRSLGGKQVVVGKKKRMNENVKGLGNPLMPSAETMAKGLQIGAKNRVQREDRLPKWWPVLLPEPTSIMDREEYQKKANRLIRGMCYLCFPV